MGILIRQLNNIRFVNLDLFSDEILASGKWVQNITWTLNNSGTLTFSGPGTYPSSPSVSYLGNPPWYSVRNDVTTIVIEKDIPYIRGYSFYICNSLTKILVDEQNPSYSSDEQGLLFNKDKSSLICCPSKKSIISISSSVTSIGSYAFSGCSELTDIYYSGSEDDWKELRIYDDSSYFTNATIHYNSGESWAITGTCGDNLT